ncbi:unnamed protein product [Caenorhabditis nigoni]
MVQFVAAEYLLFGGSVDLDSVWTDIFVHCTAVIGPVSIFLLYFMIKLSWNIFHPSDFLDFYLAILLSIFIFLIHQSRELSQLELSMRCSPIYVFFLRALIIFRADKPNYVYFTQEEQYVACKLWTGKVYTGKVTYFFPFTVIRLRDVEEVVNENLGRNFDSILLFQFTLRSVENVAPPVVV